MESCVEWKGTSLTEIYGSEGPWNYSTTALQPSKYHAVLFELPPNLKEPPKPHYNSQTFHWDEDYVKMPYSHKNLFPVKIENVETILESRWNIIREALLQSINNSKMLENAISSYNHKLPKLFALHHFFEKILEEDESEHFFTTILPGIIHLALRMPELIPGNIPLLKKGLCRSVSLSQLQIACILANGFLCTIPWSKNLVTYPGLNFIKLFAAQTRLERVSEKLKCICHYFRRILSKTPVGVVTFERKWLHKLQMPRWDRLENNLGKTKLHITSFGTIENDASGLFQVDFANKYIGGGVLGLGCVQEEIRFVICPELIAARLFTESLDLNEAFVVTGIERYSNYDGYGDTFKWSGNHVDETPYDKFARRRTTLVAIDATHFEGWMDQFSLSYIIKELNKAYTGFHSRSHDVLPAVATGNWGCGAFNGNAALKFLIQLMACSAANRNMVYFTFGDKTLRDKMHNMYMFLAKHEITIKQLWELLCKFHVAKQEPLLLYSYLEKTFLENKKQLSIRQFFNNCKNNDKELPSTSKSQELPATNDFIIDMSDTESTSPMDVEIQSSPDIIENSQEDIPILYKKARIGRSSSLTGSDKSAEVVNFISLLDGAVQNTTDMKNKTNNTTKLTSILDSMTKRKDVEMQNMDIEESTKKDSSVRKTLQPKVKISDYFSRIKK